MPRPEVRDKEYYRAQRSGYTKDGKWSRRFRMLEYMSTPKSGGYLETQAFLKQRELEVNQNVQS